MRKHLLFFMSVLVLIVALSACGAKKEEATMAEKTPSATVAPAATDAAATTAPVSTEAAQEVKLIASAATFKFDKPEYHVKKGVPVNLSLEMKDGKHGARLVDFDVNLNSETPTATFTPDKAGTFLIKCSVPCGDGHMNMTANLIVE
ncbi:cytochrome C oxidase subunit II [Paenibacillus psychroresistens]|uniref:Cytochrome C oxidase subunit II n=1 Tax=Paenibacillus psychroresistens TaxID=1778678 RepID=A0A6B8RKT5_9BACL|nr:cytochrome C oxidase subunit II [Paenibacillus psychroresistens]QGQ96163.1 cytochrome C oxidase subunit II [Paenibacillus psychroresistens]